MNYNDQKEVQTMHRIAEAEFCESLNASTVQGALAEAPYLAHPEYRAQRKAARVYVPHTPSNPRHVHAGPTKRALKLVRAQRTKN